MTIIGLHLQSGMSAVRDPGDNDEEKDGSGAISSSFHIYASCPCVTAVHPLHLATSASSLSLTLQLTWRWLLPYQSRSCSPHCPPLHCLTSSLYGRKLLLRPR